MSQITKTIQKSVNSKPLFKEVDNFIKEVVRIGAVRWASKIHRDSFVDLIEGFLMELAQDGKIVQMNVTCDDRNNPPSKTSNGIYCFNISYKQRNCLNTTQIEYVIDANSTVPEVLSDLLYP